MQEKSDEQLMTAVMAGDQVAFAALVTRHHAPLLGYLYRLVGGDRQLSEDLVQETLLHVLRQRTYQADRPSSPGSTRLPPIWPATISSQPQCASACDQVIRRKRCSPLDDSAPGPEERALAAEQGSEVRAALAQLERGISRRGGAPFLSRFQLTRNR